MKRLLCIILCLCMMVSIMSTSAFAEETHEHVWEEVSYKAPTCSASGSRSLKCECGAKSVKAIDPTGHTWDDGVVTKEATCSSAGVRIFTCTVPCGATKSESIEATGHSWDDGVVTKEATCSSAGVRIFTCTVPCGATKSESIEATGHTWNDGVVTKAPTAGAEGVRTYTCTIPNCGASKTEAIAMLSGFSAVLASSSGTYNGTVHTPDVLVSDGSTALTLGTDYILNWSAEAKNAGSYTVTVIGINSYAECVQTLSYTINQAPVTVSANAASKKFGTSDPVFSYTASGLVQGETLSGRLGRTTGESSGTYEITIGNLIAQNPNYAITFIPASFVITSTSAEDVINKINGLRWLPDLIVDPGNEYQRSEVLKVWSAYNNLSYSEQQKVPAELYDWLYYLVASTDYAILSGSGSTWYKGRSSGFSIYAIDPRQKFAGIRVDGELIDSSNYSAYWYGDNDYGYEDVVVVTLKPSYLTNLGFGKHTVTICYWNGYAPGHFYVMEASGSPPTGDSANFPLWSGMMLLSAFALGAAVIVLKPKKKEE